MVYRMYVRFVVNLTIRTGVSENAGKGERYSATVKKSRNRDKEYEMSERIDT